MINLIKVGNQEISTKEFRGQRVVTFKDIDLVHERADGTAKRNFNANKDRFIEREDYFSVKPSEVQPYEIRTSEINNAGTYLITEQGYLMLVKSFTDDLAWEVQRDLVKGYFNKQKPLSQLEQLKLQQGALLELDEKVEAVDNDLQEFKRDLPILGIEESRITGAVRLKGVRCLGGKDSNAYKDKSVRGRVYADIYGQLKREFGVNTYKAIKRSQCDTAVDIINGYLAPFVLAETINNCNAQMDLGA